MKNNCWLNYHGSKGKFYEKIKHILPKEDNLSCLDLFAGGTSLSSMLPAGWNIVCNDNCWDIGKLQGQFLSDYKDSGKTPEEWVKGLSESMAVKDRNDIRGYKDAKNQYNMLVGNTSRWERSYLFFDLVCSSFSNYIRFNDKGEWNLNFGKRYFNPSMQRKLVNWLKLMGNRDVTFNCSDWKDLELNHYDFLIVDPPYLNTCAQYNSSWSLKDAEQLLDKVDEYTKQGGRFILFEEVLSKGIPNNLVTEWMQKYKHITLGDESTGCNYQRNKGITLEVCIYN